MKQKTNILTKKPRNKLTKNTQIANIQKYNQTQKKTNNQTDKPTNQETNKQENKQANNQTNIRRGEKIVRNKLEQNNTKKQTN